MHQSICIACTAVTKGRCADLTVCLLQGLKQQLRALEWLMERHFPALAAHLQVDTRHVVLCYPPP